MTPSRQLFRSFGRESAGTSLVYCPDSPAQVDEIFQAAKKNHQRIAVRGGGHSFHDQALHNGDTGNQIVISTEKFKSITPNADPNLVTLGAGVTWIEYFNWAHAFIPLRLPGSMQTARHATAGGTMSGNCLSRFSAVLGKESEWIESFHILTTEGKCLHCSRMENSDLFFAAIGGYGYLGFVLDVTYRTVPIDPKSCARTSITTVSKLSELVEVQLGLRAQSTSGEPPFAPRAISSAWFTSISSLFDPNKILGAVFDSTYSIPSDPPARPYPLYECIDAGSRYLVELAARLKGANFVIHEILFDVARNHKGFFENDLANFLFFMDGNTVAKERFETENPKKLFPIMQQTYILPPGKAAAFAEHCETAMGLTRPTESDMLFVNKDEALMSGNYNLDGFAITFAFEPRKNDGQPPNNIVDLFKNFSVECRKQGGRLHLTKNLFVDCAEFRKMFSPQIETFECLKRKYDPSLLLQNPFSDKFFTFKQ